MNRLMVLFFDLLICFAGYMISIFFQDWYLTSDFVFLNLVKLGGLFVFYNAIFFGIFKPFRGLRRHSNFLEMWRLFVSLAMSCVLLYFTVLILHFNFAHSYIFVQNVFLICLVAMLMVRFLIVIVYNYAFSYSTKMHKKTMIYGIGSHSISLVDWINRSASNQYLVRGYLTREKKAKKARIRNMPVFNLDTDNTDWYMRKHEITTILFPDYNVVKQEEVYISKCIEMGLTVLVAPPFEGLDSSGEVHYQVKPIKFEDLLGRDEIHINMETIGAQVCDKVIMITGAAGSIGSEISRQLARFKPKLLLLFDVAESPLHNLRLELRNAFPDLNFVPVIGDIRSKERLDFVFEKYHPNIIYHAAAYKHVPLMEENPCEAVLVNVMGTKNLSTYAVNYGVESFVMISTDKAVNPTNVMGASKRIAEIFVQSLAKESERNACKTRFVTTRFGNVLGSNGSVIPYFRSQIEAGGPITVTHPDITRYFMTIPEACRLVLEAASFGNNGEIYVFDMGNSVKIVDLAKRMIELAGFVPGVDIKIEFIGLRPGEKLYEELLNDKETTMPTVHEKILVASVRQYEFKAVSDAIDVMIQLSYIVDVQETVKSMKMLVPEFVSKNSPFSVLDI